VIVVITATTFASPRGRDAILPALLAAEALARDEPGVLEYRISADPHNPLRTHGLEIYESEDVLLEHLRLPHVRELASTSDTAGASLSLTAYEGDLRPFDLGALPRVR
jgi:quinol monooxygenase YgiN